jgi:hypothetical protein
MLGKLAKLNKLSYLCEVKEMSDEVGKKRNVIWNRARTIIVAYEKF